MTDNKDCFSFSVGQARDRFLAACDSAHIPVTAFPGTATGTEDDRQQVFADIARFGSPSASRVLLLAPAEGGLSAYLSAGLITAAVQEKLYRHLARDVALLLVHAINPKGPLWPVSGVDIPRPEDWEDSMLAQAEERFQSRPKPPTAFDRQSLSNRRLSDMIEPAWDRTVINTIADQFLEECDRLYILELAEMPGSAGELSLTCDDPSAWLPQQPKNREYVPESSLSGHFAGFAGLHHSYAALARFGTTPRVPARSEDKNKDRFIPDARPEWENPVRESGTDLITGCIKAIGALE
ncbi:DUF2817 domain-containing protein [Aestuariispira insulae]|nr:DUF2817 domain-containing protein [Aestuariispira insulae]